MPKIVKYSFLKSIMAKFEWTFWLLSLDISSLRPDHTRVWLAPKCLILFVPFILSELVALEADALSDASQSFGKSALEIRTRIIFLSWKLHCNARD